MGNLLPWKPDSSLETIRAIVSKTRTAADPASTSKIDAARRAGDRATRSCRLSSPRRFCSIAKARQTSAYQVLEEARTIALADDTLATEKSDDTSLPPGSNGPAPR